MSDSDLNEIIYIKKLTEKGQLKDALKKVSELEKRNDISDHDILRFKLLKGRILCRTHQLPEAINYTQQILQESQIQGDLISYFDALLILAYAYILKGNLSQGETILIQAEELFEKLEVASEIYLREKESYMVRIRANLVALRGDTHLSLKLNEKALELAKDSEDKDLKVTCLVNLSEGYQILGEYDKAIYYAKRALEVPYPILLMWRLGILIESLLCKNDIVNAKFYFQKMSDLRDKDIFEADNRDYHYYKALILKTSLRAKDRVKAEEIFKDIIEEGENVDFPIMFRSLYNICGLFLIELRITNDIDIINEIKPYIAKLLKYSESQQSYLILAETYLLQAKLSLLTFNIKEAKQFLIQAQQIAERYGLKLLAIKISNEHDELLKQLAIWENLEKSEATLNERLKLARINEQMEDMLRKRVVEPVKIQDEESVVILIISKGGNPIFSQSFTEGWSFKDHLFGGFLSAVNSFSDEMFSQGLDRAIFGEYTLIMNAISPFIICYLFKGQSFLAQQRMKHFIDTIQNDKKIWETIKKYYQANRLIQVKDIPSLDLLVNEVFIERVVSLS
jgi:hypothetical protein